MDNKAIAAQLSEIYTLLCRAALNKDYYGVVLSRAQTINTWMDIVIAVGTTGGGISALTVWNTPYGKALWAARTVVSAFCALSKPSLQINKRIERLSRLYSGHSDIYTNLLILTSRIKRHGDITDEMINTFEAAELRYLEIAKDDEPTPNKRILDRCEEAVRKRHPPEAAWYPGVNNGQPQIEG